MNITDALNRKKPQARSVDILLDPGLAERHALMLLDLRKAERVAIRSNDVEVQDQPIRIQDSIDALRDEVEEATVRFTVEALHATRWSELVSEHPPNEEQRTDNWPYNPETMAPILLSESITMLDGKKAKMSIKQATRIWEDWSDAERSQLFLAAVAVNREVRNVPFTKPEYKRTENSEKN